MALKHWDDCYWYEVPGLQPGTTDWTTDDDIIECQVTLTRFEKFTDWLKNWTSKNLRIRFGYYSPMSSDDIQAGYDWYRLKDGVTNVRARIDEYGNRQIHPDDLLLTYDVENRVFKERLIRTILPLAPVLRNGAFHGIPEAYDHTPRELGFKRNNQFELKVLIGDSTVVNGEAFIDDLNWAGEKWEEWNRRRAEERYQDALNMAKTSLKGIIDENDPQYDQVLQQRAIMDMQIMDDVMMLSGGLKIGPTASGFTRVANGVSKAATETAIVSERSSKAISSEMYAGTREASEYLKSQGVSRQFRKQIIESFDAETIKMKVADESTYGLRFFDGINAQAKGRYLFESFDNLTNRGNLALPPEWNAMSGIKQWKVKPGTKIITGEAAPQFKFGSQYVGGEKQWYIINLDNLLEP